MDLYTVGHSNHPPEKFLKLLKGRLIGCIVDVRSTPLSQWAPFANRQRLEKLLASAKIHYIYLGALLGGLIEGPDSSKKADRLVAYDFMRHEEYFTRGLKRLLAEIKKQRTCILCSEEDPSACHRRLLIASSIATQGVKVLHIRGDGRLQTEEDLWKEEIKIDRSQILFPI
jgi:uncharacterized protein (DUF488 family)